MRMNAYNFSVASSNTPARPTSALRDAETRGELYRLLSEPVRLRLLALASVEELGVGELAELLHEGQPKISRHAAALREAGLIAARKQGTWTLIRIAPTATEDPVIADAVSAGLASCRADGTLARVDEILHARDTDTMEFFGRFGRAGRVGPPAELGAYLAAFAPLLPHRRVAVDAGTGDGALLEVLCPIFERVLAFDRAEAQVALCRERIRRRELGNVTLMDGEVDSPAISTVLGGLADPQDGADVVFASRILHHAPAPARAVRALARLARSPGDGERGGAVAILDYEAHEDPAMREREADLWMGFEPDELQRHAKDAGLVDLNWRRLPNAWQGEGPDRHLQWQLLVAFRGAQV
jgi:ArsR family transcriptional regulator